VSVTRQVVGDVQSSRFLQIPITAETGEAPVSNWKHMFKIMHAPPSHKAVICIREATFVTEYISTIIMYVSEIIMEFVLVVREIAVNEGCQHNDCV